MASSGLIGSTTSAISTAAIGSSTIDRLQTSYTTLVERAEALKALGPLSSETFREAGELLRASRAGEKGVRAEFADAKRRADQAHKAVCTLESRFLSGFRRAAALFNEQIVSYETARRIAEGAKRKQLEAASVVQKTDQQVDEAARLETLAQQTGDPYFLQAAEQILAQPIRPSVIAIEDGAEARIALEGIGFRPEIAIVAPIDLRRLCYAVATGNAPLDAITANESWLAKEAKQRIAALHDGDELFPGVRVKKGLDTTVRTA